MRMSLRDELKKIDRLITHIKYVEIKKKSLAMINIYVFLFNSI